MTDIYAGLRSKLEECQTFPCTYTFKFIVPQHKVQDVEALLRGFDYSTRESSGGKYVSFTADLAVDDTEQIIGLYKAAGCIEGCIAL